MGSGRFGSGQSVSEYCSRVDRVADRGARAKQVAAEAIREAAEQIGSRSGFVRGWPRSCRADLGRDRVLDEDLYGVAGILYGVCEVCGEAVRATSEQAIGRTVGGAKGLSVSSSGFRPNKLKLNRTNPKLIEQTTSNRDFGHQFTEQRLDRLKFGSLAEQY